MARLADDWPNQRQTCIDVLCAYLRMPYAPEPPEDGDISERLVFRAVREVRHSVIRVIAEHLQPDEYRAPILQSWRGHDFDFTGVVFDGGDFSNIEVTDGHMRFGYTSFVSGTVRFDNARFAGGRVSFGYAEFTGSRVLFDNSVFVGGRVDFGIAKFLDGRVRFDGADFQRGVAYFGACEFSGGWLRFNQAKFNGSLISFDDAEFIGAKVDLKAANFLSISGIGVRPSSSSVDFYRATFAKGIIDFSEAEFKDSAIDFLHPRKWSCPPIFPDSEVSESNILLPPSG